MSSREIHLRRPAGSGTTQPVPEAALTATAQIEASFARLREELKIPPAFPDDVLAEAQTIAASGVPLPERDETSVPFITIDPPGSMDLDQAMFIESEGEGHRVRYAIADVPAVVPPGSALDGEARRRGQTIYAPDQRTPLHPPVLSEDAASLLPGQIRPAYVWDMRLDQRGEVTSSELYRATVRSARRYDYTEVQAQIEAGTAEDTLQHLRTVGERRIALERERGGASLPMPSQEVEVDADGHFRVIFRPLLPSEDWNAQISLMTGMTAAQMMLYGNIGILRTMPEANPGAVSRFRRQARALGVDWPADQAYGELLRSLDRADPDHLALIHEATALFRGASYTPFDGVAPEVAIHAAVAAPYAHVTAPLRRLVDRFGLVICEHLARGAEVPSWCREALPSLARIMAESDQTANRMERGATDTVEAAELVDRQDEVFEGSVVDATGKGLIVQIQEPAVSALAHGNAGLGDRVRVRLKDVSIVERTVVFVILDARD